jgi:TP901 family phage tail tape measure protein
MSVGPVAVAAVKIVPDATGFRAELEKAVKKAVSEVERSGAATVRATVTATAAAGGARGASASSAATAAASRRASQGLKTLTNESNAARGALIGLSRITPVTVFGLGLYGSAAIVAGTALKRAISSTADFEHQLNVLQATSQATVGQMKAIHDEALALGADLSLPATSAGDAARAMTELSKAGLSVKDTMAGARGVLELAAAAQIDVGSAANYVATALNAFGLAGSQAAHVADVLAGASIAAQGSIDDFGLGMQQVSAVSKTVGLDFEHTAGALTELAKAGLRGSDGGTSLRTTLLRLAPTTKQASQYMEALGIQIDKTKSIGQQLPQLIDQYRAALSALAPVQQEQVLAQIFGQDAIRSASILIRGGSEALRDNTNAANQNGAAARLAAANAKGLSGAYNGLKSNLDTLGIVLGEVAKGPMTTFVQELSAIAGGATSAASEIIKLGGAISNLHFPGSSKLGGLLHAGEITALPGLAPFILGAKLLGGGGSSGPDASTIHDPGSPGAIASDAVTRLKLTEKEREKVRKQIAALIEAGKKPLAADKTAPDNLVVNQLNAQLHDSLQAELAADRAIEHYFQERLKLAKKGTGRYTIILTALEQAHSASAAVQSQIDSEAAAAKSASDAERKRRKAQALQDARDAAQAAKDLFNLQKSQFDLEIQRVTTLLPNNKRLAKKAYEDEITFLQTEVKRLEAIRKKTIEQRQLIVQYKSDIIGLKGAIKSLNSTSSSSGGGFSLNDLFKTAVDQLNEFGSNVSSGPATGGQAGSAVLASIVSKIPSGDPALKRLQGIGYEQLAQAAESNDLLRAILDALDRAGGSPSNLTPAGVVPRGHPPSAHQAAIAATNLTGQ